MVPRGTIHKYSPLARLAFAPAKRTRWGGQPERKRRAEGMGELPSLLCPSPLFFRGVETTYGNQQGSG